MEAHQQVKNGNVLKFLKDYWFLVVFLFVAAFSWSEVRGMVIQNIKDIGEVKIQAQENTAAISDLQLKYVEDITFIKTKLLELSK